MKELIIESQKLNSRETECNNIRVLNLESVPVNLESHFNDSKVIIHKTTTKEFLENCIFKNITLDAVYIDADHSYESVKSDLNLSYEIVTDGGYICGHDYSEEHFYGVFKAVNEFCDDKNLKINYLSKDGCPTYCIKK